MNSAELATKVLNVCMDAYARITNVGDDQYVSYRGTEHERQRHEEETASEHLEGLEEELLDIINWSAMTVIKLRERRASLEEADRIAQSE